MVPDEEDEDQIPGECTIPIAVPPDQLTKYSLVRDSDSEQDIARYVEIETRDEDVLHVEKIRTDYIMGEVYEVWDVTTNKDRWWVFTNMTNLYSQKQFPSLDFTLSFHVGLMARMRSRPQGADSNDPDPFDEVLRRQEQAKNRHDQASEPEDYQAVGLLLRECLISLVGVLRRRVEIGTDEPKPQDANFIEWSNLLMETLCGGGRNKQLRHHLKCCAKETWQLVNWLTHDRDANRTASSISIHSCDTVVGHFMQIFLRDKLDSFEQCPQCTSRQIRTHFDRTIEPDGDYYSTCGACGWSDRPA